MLFLNTGGLVGSITSSLFLYTKQLKNLRQTLISQELLQFLIELGGNVLDSATVDTAITVVTNHHVKPTCFLDLTEEVEKGSALLRAVIGDEGCVRKLL